MSKAMLLATTIGLLVRLRPGGPSGTDHRRSRDREGAGAERRQAGGRRGRSTAARISGRASRRDGRPVEGVTVYWTTMQGTMNPPEAVTDAEGISASRWTTTGQVSGAGGLRQPRPGHGSTGPGLGSPGHDHVHRAGVPRSRCAQHGPRAERRAATGSSPRASPCRWVGSSTGSGRSAVRATTSCRTTAMHRPPRAHRPAIPKYLSFTFANPGVYRYHCAVHGASGRRRDVRLGDGAAADAGLNSIRYQVSDAIRLGPR